MGRIFLEDQRSHGHKYISSKLRDIQIPTVWTSLFKIPTFASIVYPDSELNETDSPQSQRSLLAEQNALESLKEESHITVSGKILHPQSICCRFPAFKVFPYPPPFYILGLRQNRSQSQFSVLNSRGGDLKRFKICPEMS